MLFIYCLDSRVWAYGASVPSFTATSLQLNARSMVKSNQIKNITNCFLINELMITEFFAIKATSRSHEENVLQARFFSMRKNTVYLPSYTLCRRLEAHLFAILISDWAAPYKLWWWWWWYMIQSMGSHVKHIGCCLSQIYCHGCVRFNEFQDLAHSWQCAANWCQ